MNESVMGLLIFIEWKLLRFMVRVYFSVTFTLFRPTAVVAITTCVCQ